MQGFRTGREQKCLTNSCFDNRESRCQRLLGAPKYNPSRVVRLANYREREKPSRIGNPAVKFSRHSDQGVDHFIGQSALGEKLATFVHRKAGGERIVASPRPIRVHVPGQREFYALGRVISRRAKLLLGSEKERKSVTDQNTAEYNQNGSECYRRTNEDELI